MYDSFQDKLLETTNLCGIVVDQDFHSVLNPNWLRSQLLSLLEHHMAYRCTVRRYGTVLYCYGGDLVHALSVSLGQARNQSHKCSVDREQDSDFQTTLSEVCLTLNSKIHACAETMVREDASTPHKIEEVYIDKFISDLDPDVWKAVCLLTQPLSSPAIKSANTVNVR